MRRPGCKPYALRFLVDGAQAANIQTFGTVAMIVIAISIYCSRNGLELFTQLIEVYVSYAIGEKLQ